ncbi:brain-specific serine protease 4-like [Clavelina lepadiformis]|uniref:Uncharacterized protein n=1 Tax=Clavelina lepadiformis TaxID=159417 RepID=A0ABP0FFT2_CLALP
MKCCLLFQILIIVFFSNNAAGQKCEDVSKSCPYFKNNLLCEDYKHRIEDICRLSCGWCDEQAATWGPWRKEGCSVTCGSGSEREVRSCLNGGRCIGPRTRTVQCDAGTCPKDDCEDTYNSCQWLKLNDYCQEQYHKTMYRICRKTCDLCDGVNPDQPVTLPPRPQWNVSSECSRTCGGGTNYRIPRCPAGDINSCPRIYEDCNTQQCTRKYCDDGEENRFDDPTSCCRTPTSGRCGIPKIKSSFGRIIGGRRTTVSQWPWMVRIELTLPSGHKQLCGGSLISRQWVVTTAHCVQGFDVRRIQLILGHDTKGVRSMRAERFIIHDEYDFPRADIALIKMTTRVTYSDYILPICLPRGEKTPDDALCHATGWGYTEERRVSRDLLVVGLRKLPYEVCKEAYKNEAVASKMSRRMICAGRISGGVDTCLGDSGGPLMCQRCSSCAWYLSGLTSFGPNDCGTAGRPGVYTGARNFEGWITQHVFDIEPGSYTCD